MLGGGISGTAKRPTAAAIGFLIVASGITALLSHITEPDFEVNVLAPTRAVSAHQTEVIASLWHPDRDNEPLTGAKVKVHKLDSGHHDLAQWVADAKYKTIQEGSSKETSSAVLPLAPDALGQSGDGTLLIETEFEGQTRWHNAPLHTRYRARARHCPRPPPLSTGAVRQDQGHRGRPGLGTAAEH